MLKKILSRTGVAAAILAGMLAVGSSVPAEAKTHINIWIGVPGFDYWNGPGYYNGHYRDRLTCSEGRHIVDHRGFNSVKATDCQPWVYHYNARRNGYWYVVALDARTGQLRYWRH
jgi:hypothetical protein